MLQWNTYMQRERITPEEIKSVGGQYAMTNRFRHPSIVSLIVPSKRKENVFETEKIVAIAEKALKFVEQCGKKGGIILFVSTRREATPLVREAAEALKLPYMVDRWIGGTLSNFRQIKSRAERLEQLQKEKESGVWTKFTKKERVMLNRALANLETKFSGIVSLEQLPAAVFILDAKKEQHAVAEANKVGVPVIGFSNANADITKITYPIVANIQSRETVAFMLKKIEESYRDGVKSTPKIEEKKGEDTKKVEKK